MSSLAATLDDAFDPRPDNPLAATQAFVALQGGELVAERYADGFDAASTFISWSMAKSMLSAVCGILVCQGRLDIEAPAAVPEWQSPGDPRQAITVRQLLQMRSGLEWVEDYVDDGISDVIEMLFGDHKSDAARYAAAKPLATEPGAEFLYSSGTSNILSRLVGEIIGDGEPGMRAFLSTELWEPLAMSSAEPKFDDVGTWIASSFVYATARDFAAFGELYRNDGVVDGQRLLPAGWVADTVTSHATDAETGQGYGLHWWLANDGRGSYAASGYEGQRIQIVPSADMTFVRLGKTPAEHGDALLSFYRSVTDVMAG